jgi:peptidoglycan/LPS O-acetylase OafA/YrhL
MVTVSGAKRLDLPLWATIAVALVGSVLAAWGHHTKVEKPADMKLRPKAYTLK